ncbi:MAG: hypothetical protein RSD32_03030 [Oscillospiraceae bacterium]
MKLEINQGQMQALFWLSQGEQKSPALLSALRPRFAELKAQKYTVAVFLSGENSLPQQTASLLLRNREPSAGHALQGGT